MTGQAAEQNEPSRGSASDPVEALRQAREALDHGFPVVILDGAPLAGITRSMYEAARRNLSDAHLINVSVVELIDMARGPAFAELISAGGQYLVWLDDLSPADLVLLGAGVLDTVSAHATVLANIHTAWCQRILADRSPITGPARTVLLEYATRVTVPFEMTATDRARMRAAYPKLALGRSIGETFVGGDALMRRYLDARNVNAEGHALVQTAIDARRCGIHRGLTDAELRQLFQRRSQHGARRPSDRAFTKALEWASHQPADAAMGLLFQTAGGRGTAWQVLSYAAAADDGERGYPERRIPDQAWTAALDVVPVTDSYAIGVGAHLRGQADMAAVAFRRAATRQDSAVGSAAARALHDLDEQDGD